MQKTDERQHLFLNISQFLVPHIVLGHVSKKYITRKDDIYSRLYIRQDVAIPWRAIFTSLPVCGTVLGHASSKIYNEKRTFILVIISDRMWPYPGEPSSPRCRCGALYWATPPPTGATTRSTNSCPPISPMCSGSTTV